ncbi:O-antigen ligase family protein [Roseiconus nitratireducens]|uniref:O-antigen ligase family protein n=1 Tax=Roseiconus nitratireducens TaxID=2605748 RepID=A0A5M6D0Z9_9BACT|nr:O-antigen ligase family protein [Roseiconus nitratireducens]KAA5539289.1 O-antigen ligase family protein [Roseiconus nitratireducens]
MLPAEFSLVIFSLLILVATVWFCRNQKQDWLGVGLALSLLAPTWCVWTFEGTRIDTTAVIAVVLLILYCFHSGANIFSGLGLCDVAMVALVVWQCVVDFRYEGVSWWVPARAYGEWGVPYFAGRLAMIRRGAVPSLAPWFVGVTITITVLAVVESITGCNVWDTVITPIDDSVTRPLGRRYDLLYRATGPVRHPIFLGIVFGLLSPWAVSLCGRSSGSWRRWGWVGFAAVVIGVLSTVSRGPILGLLIGSLAWMSVSSRKACYAIAVLCILVGAVVYARWDSVMQTIDYGIESSQRGKIVTVDGQAEVFTGTNNRLFVWRVYGPLVLQGGAFGYGSEATSTFPPEIPGLPSDEKSRQRLGIVDNSFVLIGLRLGLVGLAIFIVLILLALWESVRWMETADTLLAEGASLYFKTAFCSILSVSLVLVTVYFEWDFSFWFLFHLGTVGGLVSARKLSLRGRLTE